MLGRTSVTVNLANVFGVEEEKEEFGAHVSSSTSFCTAFKTEIENLSKNHKKSDHFRSLRQYCAYTLILSEKVTARYSYAKLFREKNVSFATGGSFVDR